MKNTKETGSVRKREQLCFGVSAPGFKRGCVSTPTETLVVVAMETSPAEFLELMPDDGTAAYFLPHLLTCSQRHLLAWDDTNAHASAETNVSTPPVLTRLPLSRRRRLKVGGSAFCSQDSWQTLLRMIQPGIWSFNLRHHHHQSCNH